MLTYDELKRVYQLAHLYADDAELETMISEIGDMVDFAAQVTNAPVNDGDTTLFASSPLRDDTIFPSLPVSEILRNAPQSEDGYFVFRHGGGADID